VRFLPPRPLAAGDDTGVFDCGRDALNHWFRRHARRNQELGVTQTTVMCHAVGGAIAGYVGLSTAQIERAWLPKSQQRNRPDPLPAVLLGQWAVDLGWQGQDMARSLMFYALTTAVRLSTQVGCFCVITHPLDDDERALYKAFGFEDLPFDPARSMAVRIPDLVRSVSRHAQNFRRPWPVQPAQSSFSSRASARLGLPRAARVPKRTPSRWTWNGLLALLKRQHRHHRFIEVEAGGGGINPDGPSAATRAPA